jgi:3-oxoacyl-[acyl-carrier-protein] synthase II
MQNPCYVVGYGMIDALGNNPNDCFENMLSMKDFSSDVQELVDEDHRIRRGYQVNRQGIHIPDDYPEKLSHHMTVAQKMTMHAVDQALKMSGLPHSHNVAVIISTVSNDIEDGPILMTRIIDNKKVVPRRLVNRILDMAGSHVSSYYKFHGHTASTLSSCSSGLTAVDYGMYLADEYDYVIVGGTDAGCNSMSMKYFHQVGALANESIPFDKNRKGFVMGEGAGILILQSAQKLAEYGSTVHAKLYPAGKTNDAVDMTSPAMDGHGEKAAMRKAIENAGNVVPDAVCGHATSTPAGDPVEYESIFDVAGMVPIFAPKSMIGHTLAASGTLETIYSMLAIKNKVIPGIANTREFEDPYGILVKENTVIKRDGPIRILNNSFGFGGKNIAQIIEI